MILFALALIVILGFAAIVVDLGMLRNNRQTLVNAFDSGAIAGGTYANISNVLNQSPPAGTPATTDYRTVEPIINATIAADY
ncbi:MAG TPA: Tad domain-containing protein, partial [Candidatus Acidoferrum sp.]|nr:Tad domain-containing protein [Candidatus Acidoferrum sp.]